MTIVDACASYAAKLSSHIADPPHSEWAASIAGALDAVVVADAACPQKHLALALFAILLTYL